MEWNGMEWNRMESNGIEWNGMEWNRMEWNGTRLLLLGDLGVARRLDALHSHLARDGFATSQS